MEKFILALLPLLVSVVDGDAAEVNQEEHQDDHHRHEGPDRLLRRRVGLHLVTHIPSFDHSLAGNSNFYHPVRLSHKAIVLGLSLSARQFCITHLA